MAIVSIISIIIITSLSVALLILAGIYRKFFKDNLENTAPIQESQPELVTPLSESISDYMSKLELPAIVFNCNGKELLFILDSGSNGCHINRSVLNELGIETKSIEKKGSVGEYVATGNGITSPSSEKCDIVLSLGEYSFNVPMNVDDLDTTFDYILKSDGVQLHGILGTNFLRANNWTIDFANNMAYPAFKVKQ